MVDLVKVRKKAKQKKESGGQASPPVPETPSPRQPVDPSTRIAHFLETAGQRRTTQKQETAAPATQRELLTFQIAGEQYAIDIEHVVEIITTRPITRVPNADPSIVGILSLRGAIVTVVDVRARLQQQRNVTDAADARIIVAQHEGEDVGFEVDRVQRVVKVGAGEIDPPPAVHTNEYDDSVRGVFRHGETLTMLLDLERLLVRNGTYV